MPTKKNAAETGTLVPDGFSIGTFDSGGIIVRRVSDLGVLTVSINPGLEYVDETVSAADVKRGAASILVAANFVPRLVTEKKQVAEKPKRPYRRKTVANKKDK